VVDKRYRRLATAPDPEQAAVTAKPEGKGREATA
jgi:cytochrome c-type biogenesis protein CcmF